LRLTSIETCPTDTHLFFFVLTCYFFVLTCSSCSYLFDQYLPESDAYLKTITYLLWSVLTWKQLLTCYDLYLPVLTCLFMLTWERLLYTYLPPMALKVLVICPKVC